MMKEQIQVAVPLQISGSHGYPFRYPMSVPLDDEHYTRIDICKKKDESTKVVRLTMAINVKYKNHNTEMRQLMYTQ